MLSSLLEWLTSLPEAALYFALTLTAAIENFFPPAPSDTVIAFGAFLAARGQASLVGALIATWVGSVGGAMVVYYLGWKFGAERLKQRLSGEGTRDTERRLADLYIRYGVLGLAISRFLPGVRALVPPVAGAMRVSPVKAFLAMGSASALWYGGITVVAYRVGADWEQLKATIASGGRIVGMVAVGIVALGAIVWLLRRRRTSRA